MDGQHPLAESAQCSLSCLSSNLNLCPERTLIQKEKSLVRSLCSVEKSHGSQCQYTWLTLTMRVCLWQNLLSQTHIWVLLVFGELYDKVNIIHLTDLPCSVCLWQDLLIQTHDCFITYFWWIIWKAEFSASQLCTLSCLLILYQLGRESTESTEVSYFWGVLWFDGVKL